MKTIRMLADYDCYSLWVHEDADYIEPDELGLSPELTRLLLSWEDDYSDLLDLSDGSVAPMDPDFDDRGRAIAARIQKEVGDRYQVVYQPRGEPSAM